MFQAHAKNPVPGKRRAVTLRRSSRPFARVPLIRSQQGQSSMEYAVVCAAIAIALGVGMVDDRSVLRQLLNAFVLAYQKISFAIALP